ncbi:hypothetical protein D3C79_684380 [compost metagenome]
MQLARLLAVQQVQEMPAQGVFIAGAVDTYAMVGEAVPIAHHRREQRQQAVGLVVLGVEGQFRLQGTQQRTASAHHVHRVGVARDAFEHFLEGLRQVTQALELVLVLGQLGAAWQFAVQQQIGHFLELGTGRQVTDIVAAVSQAGTGLANGRQRGLAGHLATQACATEYFCFGHGVSPFLNLLWISFWLNQSACTGPIAGKPAPTTSCARLKPGAAPVGAGLPAMRPALAQPFFCANSASRLCSNAW